MEILGKGGTVISSVDAWSRLAPPKGRDMHWVPGRSACELANAWCGPSGACVPVEVDRLLRSHPDIRDVVIERAFPERQIRFDKLRGEPRNADLAIEARDSSGLVAITVEGKADESFDRPVSAILKDAAHRIASDERTGAIVRIEMLAAALLPPWRLELAHLGDLRYQLLTGVAGTLAWAREIAASRAVFIVHEFVTDQTHDDKHRQNSADLNQFVMRLSDGAVHGVEAGIMAGPLQLAGNDHIPRVPLYIGKAIRVTRSRA
jgi:hypothetical protein